MPEGFAFPDAHVQYVGAVCASTDPKARLVLSSLTTVARLARRGRAATVG